MFSSRISSVVQINVLPFNANLYVIEMLEDLEQPREIITPFF
jgi:hypothetical protein